MNHIDIFFIFGCALLTYFMFYAATNIYYTQKKWILNYKNRKQAEYSLYTSLPQLLLQLSSFLKSGYALPPALKYISTSKNGRLLYLLLKTSHRRTDSEKLNLFIQFLRISIALTLKHGISLSLIFKRLSFLLRKQIVLEERIRVLSFPLRAQAIVAVMLPWLVLGIFACIDPALVQNAFHHIIGRVGFSSALGLECLAMIWIRSILA